MKWYKVILLLMVIMLGGCEKKNDIMTAAFAWHGVNEEDITLLDKYDIDTIFMDIHSYKDIDGYDMYLLDGDTDYDLEDMQRVVSQAYEYQSDGVVFDIEGDYDVLADNLEELKSNIPVLVCIPYWLEEETIEKIVKNSDGIIVMNYIKGKEKEKIKEEKEAAIKYHKDIITAYEMQPPGKYGLEDKNTYYHNGIKAIINNYNDNFKNEDIGLAYHHLDILRELDKGHE